MLRADKGFTTKREAKDSPLTPQKAKVKKPEYGPRPMTTKRASKLTPLSVTSVLNTKQEGATAARRNQSAGGNVSFI